MNNSFAYCSVSISPVRKQHADDSEMISQLLFGEPITISNKSSNWIFITSHFDNYSGWVDEKQISYLSQSEFTSWCSSFVLQQKQRLEINSAIGKQLIYGGSFIGAENKFKIGTRIFELRGKGLENKLSPISNIKKYVNAPYLWGGKTESGIDCSGLSQLYFKLKNIPIQRDASQQVNTGKLIEYNKHKKGDLAFFKNTIGKVIHVGIIIEKNKIIHASGRVRIDLLDAKGIFNNETNSYSHALYQIKRI